MYISDYDPQSARTILVTFWRISFSKLFLTEWALDWSTFDLVFSKNGYDNTADENVICKLRTLLSLLFWKVLEKLSFSH